MIMTGHEKAVLYEDDFGFFKPGQVFYPQALRPIAPFLTELNGDEILKPKVFNANIKLYRRLIAESERNPSRDEDRHKMLLMLLAEEEAKDKKAGQLDARS